MRAFRLRRKVNTVVRWFFGPCAASHGREARNRAMGDASDGRVPLDVAPPAEPELPGDVVTRLEPVENDAFVP